MKKIDIALIKRYVDGEDLGEYSSEQLKNDKDFMMGVISYTNDPKAYFLCADELKKDYDFVKYLVLRFKDHSDFIIKVADFYLDNTDTDLERRELGIIMEKLLPNELSKKYEVMNETAYFTKRLEIEIAKLKDSNLESMVGMGFWLIFDSYNSSDAIINYYAASLINEIIRENNINFEIMLHNQFKNPGKLNEIGLNNYVIRFIGNYDAMLNSYVSIHLNLISNIINKIKTIQDNWDRYSNIDEAKRYNSMLGMVHDYMNISESNMSETDILYYVAKELCVEDKVKHYDISCKLDIDLDFDETIMDDMVKFEIERNLKERLIYLRVKKIMVNQLFCDKPLDLFSLIDEEKKNDSNGKSKCKITKLNPNDNK